LEKEVVEFLGDLSCVSTVVVSFDEDKRAVLLAPLAVLRACACSLSSLDGI